MEKKFQIQLLEAALEQKLSRLAQKYSDEVVINIWKEMRIGGGNEAYLSVSEWKAEMTIMEALWCLDDYCDFIEAMILKQLEKERKGNHYIPALFN